MNSFNSGLWEINIQHGDVGSLVRCHSGRYACAEKCLKRIYSGRFFDGQDISHL